MKSIYTLVPDIYDTIKKQDGWFTPDLASSFASGLSTTLEGHFGKVSEPRLRMSKLGPQCPKALWHSIYTPELAEPLPPPALIKYSYGHILENMLIMLAKASGHLVVGEQDAVQVDGVTGHRDCVIDGNIVDVKSCSSIQFSKFKNKTLASSDSFGYLDQLDAYIVGSAEDPLVTNKNSGFFLAIDKTLGHICLYEHRVRKDHILERIRGYKHIVNQTEPPSCTCGVVADGKSGNVKLDTKASYSPFKYACFPRLRTFLYASGPVYLTTVVRKPDVLEVDRNGNPVYN